ncbi:MAG: DNA-3-methyladenine glycosylase [Synechococcus sp.]|nr:DNA-3-methyladenine glycosylase [Synechococcus sp. MOX_bin32]MCY3848784.1 DNA-3-methyladenine glycosylase [Cyanobacteria bacterium MAG COS4_bin_21]MDD9804874.1 DNA-3-methyladenine glycosylase [Cyanobacteria bacterium MAG STY1_bin_7]MDD9861954.1 DNA-3-methyladenine glycosylase [Cyanobacteria bacterium MAG STY2_bin_7]
MAASRQPVIDFVSLPLNFFARPAQIVGPDLVGCRLVKRQADGGLLWGVIVETEAYSQDDPACHGYRRRSPQNETLFGEPGRFYVYVSYGIHHCVNVVTDRADWANGVLLRAVALPDEPERIAAGPGLLARRFGLDRCDDSRPVTGEHDVWMAPRSDTFASQDLVTTTRIGISQGAATPWRWYLRSSRSVSRRARGDRMPPKAQCWAPSLESSS